MRLLVARALRGVLLLILAVYRGLLSPALHAFAGPGFGCRFHPSCSEYAQEALRVHGVWTGLRLAARRLSRCHPGTPGGWDPVPLVPLEPNESRS